MGKNSSPKSLYHSRVFSACKDLSSSTARESTARRVFFFLSLIQSKALLTFSGTSLSRCVICMKDINECVPSALLLNRLCGGLQESSPP